MKNDNVILICGFARGGTNILWNLLQSHPKIVAPPAETGEILRESTCLGLLAGKDRWRWIPFSAPITDAVLFRYKMRSLDHVDNRYRAKGDLYSMEAMAKAALCLKSVNDDIFATGWLAHVYPHLSVIGLTRNGYSLADGYLRREQSARAAGQLYQRIAAEMRVWETRVERFTLVKFEDVLRDPFGVATRLFDFLGVEPTELLELRLKAKRTVSASGDHRVSFGEENRKYWFSPETIGEILVPDIDRKQAERLSKDDVLAFNQEARDAMEYFGYEVAQERA